MAWTPDVETAAVFSTLTLNSVIMGVLMFLFETLRLRPSFSDIYYPRKMSTGIEAPQSGSYFFGWIKDALEVDDDTLLAKIGLDAYVMLRFLRMCAMTGGICTFFGIFVLIPSYFTAYGSNGVVGINLYTMGNITSG
jgi:hypothetical protein